MAIQSQQFAFQAFLACALVLFTLATATGDEPVPEGLPAAIKDPAIPTILDVTILHYNDEGHGFIAINHIYKKGKSNRNEGWSPPKFIRGYGYAGSNDIAPLKTIVGGRKTRFLVFLDGDLLYSTYNNRFPIRERVQGTLEVGGGFNGSGGPWLLLDELAKKIPRLTTFERNYLQNAQLTEDEEHNIIELAKQCGITKVAKISTQYLRPSSTRAIVVESVEKTEGRNVSCKVLEIKHKKWWPPTDGPRPGDPQLGEFWAGKARPRKHTILKLGKQEFRTRSIAGLTVEECESILAGFLKGNYTLASGNANRLEHVDWTKPDGFYKHGDTISVSFPHKQQGQGFFQLQFHQIKPKINITEVMRAVP